MKQTEIGRANPRNIYLDISVLARAGRIVEVICEVVDLVDGENGSETCREGCCIGCNLNGPYGDVDNSFCAVLVRSQTQEWAASASFCGTICGTDCKFTLRISGWARGEAKTAVFLKTIGTDFASS